MVKQEIINLPLIKPLYEIRQAAYIPQKNRVISTEIIGYEIQTFKEKGKLMGVVSNYRIPQMISLRRGEKLDLIALVKDCDFYADINKAEKSSKFIAVNVDEETWRLAIGDRMIKDENSPYNIYNCGLTACCANISEARDILTLCKNEGGLILHEITNLNELLKSHGFKSNKKLETILSQLGILS